jgi:two-component system, cell cycle response regulator DivK
MSTVHAPLVLIVEDFEDASELYADYLRFHGMQVVTAATADEGLQIARARKPAVIIMDAGLPGVSGWAATEQLKADPETASICVVMVTGHVFPDAERRAEAAGVDIFLRKPCLPDELHREILAALEALPCGTEVATPEALAVARRAAEQRIADGRRRTP